MKITFVMERADFSGGARAIAEFARQLQNRGHQVIVFSVPPPQPSLSRKIKNTLRGRITQQIPAGSHLDASGVPHEIVETITDEILPDADAIIATWWRTAEWVAGFAPKKGTKFQLLQHYETWGGPPERIDAVWRLPLHKIVVAKWLADLARDKFNDPNASVVYYGLNHEQFHSPPRGKQKIPTVGMLYSTTPFKGTDLGLRAISEIPGVNLKLIGIGKPSPTIPIPANADYWQNPPQDKIRDFYSACDVFVCSSHTEGFFMPAMEAMACRCPVVSTRVGWPMEAIDDGVNGFLVSPGDATALADRIKRVIELSDPAWRKMSDAAFATAGRYTWEEAGERFEAILKERSR